MVSSIWAGWRYTDVRETGRVVVVYCSDLVEMVELWRKLSPETVFLEDQ
jgi:hypothetical protein